MPVTLNFGDRRYEVNHTRIARLLSSDKKEALYMGLWDRFKELFRTHKKKEALEALHTLIHGCDSEKQAELGVDVSGMNKIYAFEQLKQYANPAQQGRFAMRFDVNQTEILFLIDGQVIDKYNLKRLLNVFDECILKPMKCEEEALFLKICICYGKKIFLDPELLGNLTANLRSAVNEDDSIKDAVYELMRSGEDRHMPCVEWNGTLTREEIEKLKCLNMGSFEVTTQFFKIGYRELEGKVLFDMLHPTLLFLLRGYVPLLRHTLHNTMMFKEALNADYDDYHNNKREIDCILERLYRSHNGSLFISKDSYCRNMLI
ncbi:type III secretion system effector SopD2 [Salmonella enterica]|nr:type III secretion system effector SopD2 [Salmonella enterica]EBR6994674.1 type III secretion system effector SopD2 [Salmonella enterica]